MERGSGDNSAMLPRMPTPAVHLGLDAVIFAVTAEAPRILTVRSAGADDALPSGPLENLLI